MQGVQRLHLQTLLLAHFSSLHLWQKLRRQLPFRQQQVFLRHKLLLGMPKILLQQRQLSKQ